MEPILVRKKLRFLGSMIFFTTLQLLDVAVLELRSEFMSLFLFKIISLAYIMTL
jgi:hypothetical protein